MRLRRAGADRTVTKTRRRRALGTAALAASLLGWAGAAHAQPPHAVENQAHSGTSTQTEGGAPGMGPAGATPLPGQADGMAVGPPGRPARKLLWIPRVLLAPVRLAFEVATEPLRQLVLLEDKYTLSERVLDFFFNDARTFGIFPTVAFETGFGPNFGARIVHTDLFGHGESMLLRGGFENLRRHVAQANFGSGSRFGDNMHLSFNVGYEAHDRRRFYGIGNADQVPEDQVEGRLDAFEPPSAVRTFFRRRTFWSRLQVKQRLTERASLHVRHRWRVRWTGEGDPESSQRPWLGEVFEPQTVEGFGDRLLDAYTELRFHYGRFKSESPYLPLALPSEGWRFDAWLGWQKGIGQKQNFAPLGIDVQPFINLFGGDRVLRLRLHVQTALGHRDNIPFLDVPSLGGATLLRGYDTRRFRGRLAVLTTAEYRYPIQPKLAAYVFVDAGRVYANFADFGVDNLRVGYGGGLLMFTRTFFLARLQIASSIDGNVFVEFQFGTNHALGRRN